MLNLKRMRFPKEIILGCMEGAPGSLIGVDALVDGFVADSGLPVDLEVTRDLLRTPGLAEFGINRGPCLGRDTGAVPARQQPGLIERVGLLGPVATFSTITQHLPAYG